MPGAGNSSLYGNSAKLSDPALPCQAPTMISSPLDPDHFVVHGLWIQYAHPTLAVELLPIRHELQELACPSKLTFPRSI